MLGLKELFNITFSLFEAWVLMRRSGYLLLAISVIMLWISLSVGGRGSLPRLGFWLSMLVFFGGWCLVSYGTAQSIFAILRTFPSTQNVPTCWDQWNLTLKYPGWFSVTYTARCAFLNEGIFLSDFSPRKLGFNPELKEGCLIPWSSGRWQYRKYRIPLVMSWVRFKFDNFPVYIHFMTMECSAIQQLISRIETMRGAQEV